jgi:hypothetical protein
MLNNLIAANDALVAEAVAAWPSAATPAGEGAWLDEYGLPSVHGTARQVQGLVCALLHPASAHHARRDWVPRVEQAVAYLDRAQHADGTIDLLSTNFHSPPDTAFVVEVLAPVVALARARPWAPLKAAIEGLERFLHRAGEALVVGGVHTPNHRWVVAAALVRLHLLAPDPRYLARVEAWLAEGIDQDPDGQYTERSTGGYSAIVDRAFLTLARGLGRPEFFEPVRRNLVMTLHYLHPHGELATEASRRQDQYQRVTVARYAWLYRAMAHVDGDGRFATLAAWCEAHLTTELTGDLMHWLEEPAWAAPLPPGRPLPEDFARHFAYSGLVRVRRGDLSATLLEGNPTFFALRRGRAALEAVRLAAAFFGRGQFVAETLTAADGGWRLRRSWRGEYYQPLPADRIVAEQPLPLAPNGTLAVTPDAPRAVSEVQELHAVVFIRESAGGVRLGVDVSGTANVPVTLEMVFRAGGELSGVTPVPGIPEAYLLAAGTGEYARGADRITFGPGTAGHRYTQLRGALPKGPGPSVYLTGLTPWRHELIFH